MYKTNEEKKQNWDWTSNELQNDELVWDSASKPSKQNEWDWDKRIYVKCEDGQAKKFACDPMLTDDYNFKLEKSQNDELVWDSASKSSKQKEWDWEKRMNVKPENAQPTTFAWDPKYYHDCTNKFEKPQNDELFFVSISKSSVP